jgi:hypothetical protein
VRAESLLLKEVMVVKGNGTPAFGPTNLLIRGGTIEAIGKAALEGDAATQIEGNGRYVIPGLINMHGHIMESRAGIEMPIEYQMNLWLASGITTVRDVGSKFERSLRLRQMSDEGSLAAPRIYLYPFVREKTRDEVREKIHYYQSKGADGLKLYSLDRDLLQTAMEEASRFELRTTIHVGVEETTAWDLIDLGVTSVEHWYGVPDAALDGVQRFPADFSYSNEVDRFRYAGRIWREVNEETLSKVLSEMVAAELAWDPTFAIYEASRDLTRAQNKPWFKRYLHPALDEFFVPNLDNHGSYFIGWTNTDEVYWRENYQIWMRAVREFARRGGTVCTGEDAGFIYLLYGFGLLRELELQEEAGCHPLEVLRHATVNGAKVLGVGDRIGRIREGYSADLALVNGNPLENLRLLYPTGATVNRSGKAVAGGGIEWTVRGGVPYHGPTLLKEVREMVSSARVALAAEAAEGGP